MGGHFEEVIDRNPVTFFFSPHGVTASYSGQASTSTGLEKVASFEHTILVRKESDVTRATDILRRKVRANIQEHGLVHTAFVLDE